MNSLPLIALLVLVGFADAASNETCCKSDIVKESERSLFDPPLESCNSTTTFVCTNVTMIIVNDKTGIAASTGGKAIAELYCMGENWVTAHGTRVSSITCRH